MDGMLKKSMGAAVGGGQAPQPMGSPAAMQGNMADGNGMENVSAEEQADYDRGITAAMTLLHGDANSQAAVIKSLDPKNVVGSVAQAAVGIRKWRAARRRSKRVTRIPAGPAAMQRVISRSSLCKELLVRDARRRRAP